VAVVGSKKLKLAWPVDRVHPNMEAKFVLTITNEEDFDKLTHFLRGTSISANLITFNRTPSLNLSLHEMNEYKYIPNSEFKAFCGSENMNQYGHISLNSAYKVVVNHAKLHNLLFHSHIDLDKTLSEALKSDNHSILISELLIILVNLFTKKN